MWLRGEDKILTMNGSLQLSAKSVGLFEAFYNSLKPIQVCAHPPTH
jgi:hypothetical protein